MIRTFFDRLDAAPSSFDIAVIACIVAGLTALHVHSAWRSR